MKLSLALTNYNRYEMLLESFDKVLNDDRISEIVISDDCSTPHLYESLQHAFKLPEYHKVKMYRNEINIGMSLNKRKAISLCSNEWVIIFDSDNVIGPDYLDALETCHAFEIDPSVIYMPDFALPQFNYTKFAGRYINSNNVSPMAIDSMGNCCLNTCNYVVNRGYYLHRHVNNPDHVASDTVWHNYRHLLYGGAFYIVPAMQYFHRDHPGSGFRQDLQGNMDKSEIVRKLIMAL